MIPAINSRTMREIHIKDIGIKSLTVAPFGSPDMPDHIAPRIVEKHVRRQVSDNEHNHRQHENETEAIKWKPRPSHEPWVDPLPAETNRLKKDFERIADDIPQKGT